MSRNLCRTDCHICHGPVAMTGVPYKLPEDARYFAGMLVCDAECVACSTLFTAWLGKTDGRPAPLNETGFYDLSYRSTFNDEPGPDDVPNRDKINSYHMVTVCGRVTYLKERDD